MMRGKRRYRVVMRHKRRTRERGTPAITLDYTAHVRANNVTAARRIAIARFVARYGIEPNRIRVQVK